MLTFVTVSDLIIRHLENTAAIIEALVAFKHFDKTHRQKEIEKSVVKAVHFLENRQLPDGSW